jgi:hypothetical protein
MMTEKHATFLGTYFNKETVLRLANAAKILAWVVLGVHLFQLCLSIVTYLLQIARGFWVGQGPTDILQNILYAIMQPLHGVVYFFALLGISQLLLIFMDIEDNTRRAARP